MTEAQLQSDIVRWFRKTYPGHVVIHVPNGGRRTARGAATLKRMGVVAGVPDLFIPKARLWIELKAGDGKVSDEQRAMHAYLRQCCYRVAVCRNFKQATIEISDCMFVEGEPGGES